MNENKKSRNGCLWAAVIVMAVSLAISGLIIIGLASFNGALKDYSPPSANGTDEYPELTEVWSYGEGETKVVKIPVKGLIFLSDDSESFPFRSSSTMMTLLSIRRATNDPKVKAIILDIDSGGGGVTASDIIYNALLDFKKSDAERKVVALFGDTAASGAYYIAMGSDYIMAHPTTITGSIGVIIQVLNMKELGHKIGIKDVTIKSGENKDLFNPFETMTSSQTNMIQGIVDDMQTHFVSIVSKGRNMPEQEVRKLATGEIFLSAKAVENGLIDSIGYWDDAVAKTAELLNKDTVKVYRYQEEFSFSSLFKAQKNVSFSEILHSPSRTRLLYLWQL